MCVCVCVHVYLHKCVQVYMQVFLQLSVTLSFVLAELTYNHAFLFCRKDPLIKLKYCLLLFRRKGFLSSAYAYPFTLMRTHTIERRKREVQIETNGYTLFTMI